MTFWETIQRGEYVILALAVLFIFVICIWVIRASKIRCDNRSYRSLMHRVKDHVTEGDLENACQRCESYRSPGARIIGTGLKYVGRPISQVNGVMEDISAVEKKRLSRGVRWILAMAVIAPMLGLGGTLVGIIDRLRNLGETGPSVDISMLCAAIAPTLVTTVVGIGVGIFAFIAMTFLEGNIFSARRKLDKLKIEFLDLLNQPS